MDEEPEGINGWRCTRRRLTQQGARFTTLDITRHTAQSMTP